VVCDDAPVRLQLRGVLVVAADGAMVRTMKRKDEEGIEEE
jgi:hypothetical protein